MLTLERCREILGDDCTLSDSELELLRDQLYGLADVAVEAFVEQRKRRKDARPASTVGEIRAIDGGDGVGHVGFPDAVALLPEEARYDVEERAAIQEYEGGLDRDRAERAAFTDYRRNHRPRND